MSSSCREGKKQELELGFSILGRKEREEFDLGPVGESSGWKKCRLELGFYRRDCKEEELEIVKSRVE